MSDFYSFPSFHLRLFSSCQPTYLIPADQDLLPLPTLPVLTPLAKYESSSAPFIHPCIHIPAPLLPGPHCNITSSRKPSQLHTEHP